MSPRLEYKKWSTYAMIITFITFITFIQSLIEFSEFQFRVQKSWISTGFPVFSSLSGVTGNAPCSCLGSKHLSVGGEHKECYKEIQIYDCHPVYESNSRSLGIPWPNNWSLNFEGFTITIKLCLCNESSFPQNGAIHLSDQIISYQTRWPNTRVVEIMHHKHKWPENVNPCW